MSDKEQVSNAQRIVILMFSVCAFFTYFGIFDEIRYSAAPLWLLMGGISAIKIIRPRLLISANQIFPVIIKMVFLLILLLGGIRSEAGIVTLAFTTVVCMGFLTSGFLLRTVGWYDFFFSVLSICSGIFVAASILQVMFPAFMSNVSKILLSETGYYYNQRVIRNGWNIGIAVQASYQIHYILPLVALSFSNVLLRRIERKNIHWFFLFLASLISVVLCNKRMPTVAMGFTMIFCFLLVIKNHKIKTRIIIVLVVVATIATIMLLSPFGMKIINHLLNYPVSEDPRIEIWKTAIKIWKENKLFGTGLNGLTKYYTVSAHNSYIQVLSEEGIIGLMCYLFITIVPFKKNVKVFRRIQNCDIEKKFQIYVMASVFFQLFCIIHSITESVFSNEVIFLPFIVMGAVGYSVEKQLKEMGIL